MIDQIGNGYVVYLKICVLVFLVFFSFFFSFLFGIPPSKPVSGWGTLYNLFAFIKLLCIILRTAKLFFLFKKIKRMKKGLFFPFSSPILLNVCCSCLPTLMLFLLQNAFFMAFNSTNSFEKHFFILLPTLLFFSLGVFDSIWNRFRTTKFKQYDTNAATELKSYKIKSREPNRRNQVKTRYLLNERLFVRY